jgi:ATP/maltotriose-dependent transcriptional regulator MalT
MRGRLQEAVETADAALEAARLAGNPQGVAFALVANAWTAASLGDIDRARTIGDEAIAAIEGLDASVLTRGTHAHLSVMWLDIGEVDRCLDSFRAVGMPDFPSIEPGRRGWMYAALARVELTRGDRDAARGWVERAEATLAGLNLPLADAWTRHARAAIALADGKAEDAAALALEAVAFAESIDAPIPAARCRTLAGEAFAAAGRRDDAVRELQHAEAELSALGAARYRDEAARELRRLGTRISSEARRVGNGAAREGLTAREQEIASLVAEGRTNKQVAAALFLSDRTIEHNLSRIYAKLGVRTRTELAGTLARAA